MSTASSASPLPKAIAIVGPTASGKTGLSLAIARASVLAPRGGEIISADSRQIYRGMDIGTAKAARDRGSDPRAYISEGIPHHLVDIRDPDEDYTVAEFKRDADAAIDSILSRDRLPILVGGTGLYIRAVVDNLDIPRVEGDPVLRAAIEADIAAKGLASVFEKLVALDPEAAYIVDGRNPRRVVRALEVATLTGRPFTSQRLHSAPLYDFLILGLSPAPEVLRERIDRRIDEMMRDGLVEEVKKLLKKYRRADGDGADGAREFPIAFDAIGYREIIDYLDGRITLNEAVAAMKMNTWHFAKRQMTWFKKDKRVRWVDGVEEAERLAKEFLAGGVD
jgi:tRNA dimethylallyltransferase